ncbi:Holliday junction resolvase RuvX [Oceanivirga salmonicida]|uniref:Holliday junction resolvase RuvX n=1 Tax=Oceanivirga salmonicida TaxID=1769291 RepID=UPI000A9EA570|nr:Holliday junction resolvase RuvX [Oceanivirga salmonicida]
MKKYIGLDLGDVRIGVAKCDPLGILATSLLVINREKEDAIKKILEICADEGTYKLVVGKPLRLSGASEIQVEKVEKFINELKEKDARIEVNYIDERYTTKEAEYYLRNFSKKNGKQKRQVVDMIAATIILQTFLDGLK